MNFVLFNGYAEGYYSGKTYQETVVLTEEQYNLHKDDLEGLTFYKHDLDGKHSEIEGDVNIEFIDEDHLYDFDCSDGESLLYKVIDATDDVLTEEILNNNIDIYLKLLDEKSKTIKVELELKDYNMGKLFDFCKDNNIKIKNDDMYRYVVS